MTKRVQIELEVETGLTNNALESMYQRQFGDDLVSVSAYERPDVPQEPCDGPIKASRWADEETFAVDVGNPDDVDVREYYTFEVAEAIQEED